MSAIIVEIRQDRFGIIISTEEEGPFKIDADNAEVMLEDWSDEHFLELMHLASVSPWFKHKRLVPLKVKLNEMAVKKGFGKAAIRR